MNGRCTEADCVLECFAIGLGRISNSASDTACGFNDGVELFDERISSLGGDRASERDVADLVSERMSAAGRRSALGSGSSGMVSWDSGRAVLDAILAASAVGDLISRDVLGLVDVAEVRDFDGLVGVVRDDVVDGRFGGADATEPPNVVRRVLSVVVSGFAVREVLVPIVDVRADGLLFSTPSFATASALLLVPAGFRTDDVTGRVGGLLIVLPDVRDAIVLVRVGVDVVGVLVLELGFVVLVAGGFLDSSVDPGRADGRVAPVVRLSILVAHWCWPSSCN